MYFFCEEVVEKSVKLKLLSMYTLSYFTRMVKFGIRRVSASQHLEQFYSKAVAESESLWSAN